MKKFLKKQIIIIALIMFLLPNFISFIYAANEENEFFSIDKSEIFSRWEKLSEEQMVKTIQPAYFNLPLKNAIKRSTYNQYLQDSENDSSKYDLREKLSNISNINVKNQKATGACWAFSYSSVIETTIANKYNRQVLEYSPMHIDYMTASKFNRKVGDGGTQLMAMAYGASGLGPVYESELPFESVYDEENNSASTYYLNDINDVELNQIQRARIEDEKIFPGIYKSYGTDSISYQSGNNTTYTDAEVKAIRNLVKEHIKENGGVLAMFYSDIGTTQDNQTISQHGYYNSEKYAFYCNDSTQIPNHAVTIVGWDDTFSKDYFALGKRPLNDGAYIVLNSWGTEFGDSGYYYVSYDDAIIETSILGISEIVEKENPEDKFYDKMYEYDELGANYAIGTGATNIYAANVFNRQGTVENEYLSEIGVYLLNTQGVEIYVNPVDGNKDNCTLVASYTGSNALETGYHTLKLASPVELTGEQFVVKINYINAEGASVPLECDLYASGQSYTKTAYDSATSNEEESFVSVDGTTWQDVYNLNVGYTVTLKDTNACIKAFTTISDGEPTVTVTGVSLDKENITIKEEETATLVATVLPEDATNQNIIWSSSDEDVATVANGVITGVSEGTATIKVKTEEGNFEDTCTVTVEEKATEKVAVTGVTLNKQTVTIKEDATETLVATVEPADATNQNVIWSSNDNTVATVANGVVTGVSTGTATITVTTQDGSFTDTCVVTVEEKVVTPTTVAVTGVTLNKETVTIKEEETETLVATVMPEDATNQNVIWSSNDNTVATVASGVITGVSEGTATITVTTQDGSFTDTCVVTVEEKVVTPTTVAVTGVTLDKQTLTLKEGITQTLVPTIQPADATNQNVIWSSSAENVATVANGVVTGVSVGTATITVKTQDGNFTATCIVTVEKSGNVKVTGIELDKKELKMQVGEKTNLVATIKPLNATNKEVLWTSSDENVATISEKGIIEALKVGTTTIIVATKDGNHKATCQITVSEKTNTDDDIYTEKEHGKMEEGKDTTIVKGEIPKAGAQTLMIVFIIVAIIVFVTYKKYKTFEDIK